MLVAERHQKIIELINERKSVRVSELSKMFSITDETVRRDLEKLEKLKVLVRSHGGAVSVDTTSVTEVSYLEREITNVKEKKQIASEAVKQVFEGDKIILDASTTAWYMAKELPNINITVLTNSIRVATELSAKKEITVIVIGGILLSKSLSNVGPMAESSLASYHVYKTFISCKGFHLEHGMSEGNEQQARIKELMVNCADKVYIMIDHSKFDAQAFTRFSSLHSIDYVITDSQTDQQTVQQLTEKSVTVIKTM